LMCASPDPSHGRERNEQQDEERGSQADGGHGCRFWTSDMQVTIVRF
jgi:hypothetical protein